jgi:N-acetylmuramoyl-L-alanine amidase
MWLIFTVLICVAQASPLQVLIDPGHGGRDHGTTKNGVQESDITLSVSRQLADLLRKDKRFKVTLTRDQDQALSLSQRSNLAQIHHADLFLSIHVNSSPEPHAKGAEFYFQNQLAADEESMLLAHREEDLENGNASKKTYDFVDKSHYPAEVSAIVADLLDGDRIWRSSQLTKALKQNWRGTRKNKVTNSVRQAPFFVLSNMLTPSALVELGFLTNSEDFRELTSTEAQKRMAQDLYRGLVQYRGNN